MTVKNSKKNGSSARKNKSCIARLSIYKNSLIKLKGLGLKNISSENIGESVGINSSQIRKDFSTFNITGNKRGGYAIDSLIQSLNEILGKEKTHEVVLIGAGKVGMALTSYKGISNINIVIKAAFDRDNRKINKKAPVPLLPMEDLPSFLKKNRIKIAILALPESAAQEVSELLIENGIRGILNFSAATLEVPENVIVNDVHLEVELESLIYFVDNQ